METRKGSAKRKIADTAQEGTPVHTKTPSAVLDTPTLASAALLPTSISAPPSPSMAVTAPPVSSIPPPTLAIYGVANRGASNITHPPSHVASYYTTFIESRMDTSNTINTIYDFHAIVTIQYAVVVIVQYTIVIEDSELFVIQYPILSGVYSLCEKSILEPIGVGGEISKAADVLRKSLMTCGTYLGDPAFVPRNMEWISYGSTGVLCSQIEANRYHMECKLYEKHKDELTAPIPEPLNLVGLHRVEEALFFFTADANWKKDNDFNEKYCDAKATCVLGAASEALFAVDEPLIRKNLDALLEMRRSQHRPQVKGAYAKVGNRLLPKLRHVLFERRQEGDDDDIANDTIGISDWPVINSSTRVELNALTNTHRVIPIPAFDIEGENIHPTRYTEVLKGADVRVVFNLLHWGIGRSKSGGNGSDTFVLDLVSIRAISTPKLRGAVPRFKRTGQRDAFDSLDKGKRRRV
ncbi:hypothetical protein EW026_g7392 [Hermanssonia centrifuga]|uniref:Uncharacterized protein n=1 Tax=Hermanssonia centrifuga TaxID=98765 RepID=A0A4S4K7Z4_9APHY|nr:hypothetical protein EW026_g7392 [Hermanssonia centrifuga]